MGYDASVPSTGYFHEGSIIRRVHREQIVALGGPRALLMQAAQPVAFAGFFASTGALENPYPRLERTAAALNTVMFGTRAAADRVTARIRRVHSRVRGELNETVGPFPAGTPWAADDPELLLWIIATLVDSSLLVYERYVRPLTQAERQEYWSDYRTVGRLFGSGSARLPRLLRICARIWPRCWPAMICSSAPRPARSGSRSCSSRRCPSGRARCWSWPTSSPSGCCPDGCGANTA